MADAAQGGLGGLGGFSPTMQMGRAANSAVSSSFSPEASNAFFNQAYQSLLGRAPEDTAVQAWQTSNQMPTDLINNIMASPEWFAKQVPLMYKADLGRPADQEGLNYWLNSGLGLSDINEAMRGSQEGQSYQQMMDSQPLSPYTPDPSWQQVVFPQDAGAGNAASSLMSYYTQAFSQLGAKDPTTAAAALIGNFGVESPGLNPTTNEIGGGGGYGIAQWTDPARKAGLQTFAKGLGLDPGSLEAQAKYALQEMTTDPYYRRVALNPLLSATDPTSAMNAALGFEAPKGYSVKTPEMSSHYDRRTANMLALLAANTNGGTTGMTPDALSAFMRMQGETAAPAPPVPLPPPRPSDLGVSNVPLPPPRPSDLDTSGGLSGDPRTGMITAMLDNTQTGLNNTLTDYTTATNTFLNNPNYFGSPLSLGFQPVPTFGSNPGQPNGFGGVGGYQILTVPRGTGTDYP